MSRPVLRAARAAVPVLLGACAAEPDVTSPPLAAQAPVVGAAATHSVLAKAFALVRTPSVSGRLADAEQYNAAGAQIEWERGTPGRLPGVHTFNQFRFNSLGSVLAGAPHVQLAQVRTPEEDPGDVVCSVGATRVGTNGADVEAFTDCVRDRGSFSRPARVDARVAAVVLDHDAAAAFATVREDGAAENGRRLARAERTGVGRYRVFFRRDPLFGPGAKPVAVVTSRSGRARCQLFSVGSRHQRADEFGVEVDCHAPGGARRDAPFNVLALAQTSKTGYALVRAGGAVDAAHTSNPAGAVFVEHPGPGLYRVGFVGLDRLWADGGAALVTAHGASGEQCLIGEWRKQAVPAPGVVHVAVECRAAGGALADAGFAVLATTGR